MALFAVGVHALAIVSANWLTATFGLVPAGPGLLVTAGTFAAGFALLARDVVHLLAGVPWVFFGVALGGALSWVTSSPQIAAASTLAFITAELVDMFVFVPVRKRAGFVQGAFWSNVVSAPVDTVVFLVVAGFPLTWMAVGGQFVGKVVWATLVPLTLWGVARYGVFRYHQRGSGFASDA